MTVETTSTVHEFQPGDAMAAEALTGMAFLDPAHLRVWHIAAATGVRTELSPAAYTVAGNGRAGTGTITATGVWPADDVWRVERHTPAEQKIDIRAFESLPAEDVERELDRVVMVAQERQREEDRSFRMPAGEAGPVIPLPSERADSVMGFDEAGAFKRFGRGDFKGDPGGNVMAVGLATQTAASSIAAGTNLIQTAGYSSIGIGPAIYAADALATVGAAALYPRFVKTDAAGRRFRIAGGRVSPEQAGVVPATETNAGAILADAFRYLLGVEGGGAVPLTPGATYVVADLPAQQVGTTFTFGDGKVMLPPGVGLIGNNATFKAAAAGGADLVKAMGDIRGTYVVAPVAMAAGDDTFQLATVADALAFAVGETVLWRLGDVPLDPPETYNWGFATVEAINTGTGVITLSNGLSRAWDGTGANNKYLYRVRPLTGDVLAGAAHFRPSVVGGHISGVGISITRGLNVRLGSIDAKGCAAGAVATQYVEGFHFDFIGARDSTQTGANQGQGCRFAESRGRVDEMVISNCWKEGVYAEAASDIHIGDLRDHNANASTSRRVVVANGESRVHVDKALLTGLGGHGTFDNVDGKSDITFGTMRCELASDPYVLPMPGKNVDTLSLRLNGVEELYCAADAYWTEWTVELFDGMGKMLIGPRGIVLRAEAYLGGPSAGTGAVASNFDFFNVGKEDGAGGFDGGTMAGTLSATPLDEWQDISAAFITTDALGSVAGRQWSRRAQRLFAYIDTVAGPGLDGSGKYIKLRFLVIPNRKVGYEDAVDPATRGYLRRAPVLEGRKTHDWPSLAAGAQQSTTLTVTGAAVGDLVSVSLGVALSGTQLWGEVTAADTVTVYHRNGTAGAVDLASAALTARVTKRALA